MIDSLRGYQSGEDANFGERSRGISSAISRIIELEDAVLREGRRERDWFNDFLGIRRRFRRG
ncbi:MAG TPA: hypothetical protein PLR69_08655, partial [Candidatus Limiplasma sp.]|nr:hypothetical protein [Candidatus Limiplasma sp.]